MRLFSLILFLFFSGTQIGAQAEIRLKNPSFEDEPQHGKVPKGWKDCGLKNESPPDVQPVGGSFRVTRRPLDGKTYLAMIVRDNDSWESVGQKLKKPLKKGNCYTFELNLCRSNFYLSRSRITGDVTNYNTPVRLLLWGGKDLCDKSELLGKSPLILNYDWQTFSFRFDPKEDYQYLMLEAYYQPNYLLPYCGNILVDNASAIQIGCTIDSQWVTSPPAERIEWPKPNNLEALEKALIKLGPKVKFQADESMLEKHRYRLSADEPEIIQNKYLQMIVKAIEELEEIKLIVGVKGRFLAIENRRKLELEKALIYLGLSRNRFEVKIYNKATSNEKWLWTSAGQEILMRIE